jgi:hypothetical protein
LRNIAAERPQTPRIFSPAPITIHSDVCEMVRWLFRAEAALQSSFSSALGR